MLGFTWRTSKGQVQSLQLTAELSSRLEVDALQPSCLSGFHICCAVINQDEALQGDLQGLCCNCEALRRRFSVTLQPTCHTTSGAPGAGSHQDQKLPVSLCMHQVQGATRPGLLYRVNVLHICSLMQVQIDLHS